MSRLARIATEHPWWFPLGVLILLAQRLFHFGAIIDSPHTWRQCDTANYIWDYYQNSIDLLHPTVAWMGGHNLILEFPLHEAISALLYQGFGPSHIWARLVTFVSFLFAVYWFYRIVKHLGSVNLARWATIFYLALPLSLFYSRAVHIDFTAIAFAHGMFWFALRGIEGRSWSKMMLAALFAAPAFLIKAPYAFYFVIPLIWWVMQKKQWRFLLQSGWLLLVPVGLFAWWFSHVQAVNGSIPEWPFLAGHHNFTEMGHWYFGSVERRLDWDLWGSLLSRFPQDVARTSGLLLAFFGIGFAFRRKEWHFMLWWLAGSTLYVLIFLNLNGIHDYYQLPMVAPLAIAMAIPLLKLKEAKQPFLKRYLPALISLLVICESVVWTEAYYYRVGEDSIVIGEAIAEHTNEDDLVIVSYGGFGNFCPNILYRAKRQGWSTHHLALDARTCFLLHQEAGADYLAIIRPTPVEGEMSDFVSSFSEKKVIPLVGLNGSHLYLYHMRAEDFEASRPATDSE